MCAPASHFSPTHLPTYPHTYTGAMFSQAMPIAVLAYVEAYSISSKYGTYERLHPPPTPQPTHPPTHPPALMYRYKFDCQQDLAAYSLGSFTCALMGGVTPSGAFGRTAMSAEIGSKTPWANIFTGTFVIMAIYYTKVGTGGWVGDTKEDVLVLPSSFLHPPTHPPHQTPTRSCTTSLLPCWVPWWKAPCSI